MPTLQHIQTDMENYCFSDLLYCIEAIHYYLVGSLKKKKIGSTDLSVTNEQI